MSTMRKFELLEDLKPFRSARAVLLIWNGETYVTTTEEITVFEFVGAYGDKRDRGFACLSEESHKWEVIGGMQEPKAAWLPT